MLIFKKLSLALDDISSRLDSLVSVGVSDSDPLRVELEARLSALRELKTRQDRFDWLKTAASREKVKAVIVSNYNYTELAKVYNTTVNSLQTSMSLASERFSTLIGGPKVIDLLVSGSLDYARSILAVTLSPDGVFGYLLKDVRDLLPAASFAPGLTVSSCLTELDVLHELTVKNISVVLSTLDQTKLAFLRFVLSSDDNRYTFEQSQVKRFFDGELSLDQLQYILSAEN